MNDKEWSRYKWHHRVLSRWLQADDENPIYGIKEFSFEAKMSGKWTLVKASRRGYGWKFVVWEPFEIYGHYSNLRIEAPIRNFSLEPRFPPKEDY